MRLTSMKNRIISTSPSKQAMIKGETWAIGVPVCSCKISQLILGSEMMRFIYRERRDKLSMVLVPFLIISRRPRSFSSTLVCVRSVFQIATSNGWCLSLKARSVEEPLLMAEWWCVAFSSRWTSFSRWTSLLVRDDRCSIWVLETDQSSDHFSRIIQSLT